MLIIIFHINYNGKDIECYDKLMEQYPNYPKIWWHNLIIPFQQKKLRNISKDVLIITGFGNII
jgi:hypothetical protein